MPIFTIIYNNNSTEKIEAEDKEALIKNFSIADATAFQTEVKEIRWEEKNYCCVESISSGVISKTANLMKEK